MLYAVRSTLKVACMSVGGILSCFEQVDRNKMRRPEGRATLQTPFTMRGQKEHTRSSVSVVVAYAIGFGEGAEERSLRSDLSLGGNKTYVRSMYCGLTNNCLLYIKGFSLNDFKA